MAVSITIRDSVLNELPRGIPNFARWKGSVCTYLGWICSRKIYDPTARKFWEKSKNGIKEIPTAFIGIHRERGCVKTSRLRREVSQSGENTAVVFWDWLLFCRYCCKVRLFVVDKVLSQVQRLCWNPPGRTDPQTLEKAGQTVPYGKAVTTKNLLPEVRKDSKSSDSSILQVAHKFQTQNLGELCKIAKVPSTDARELRYLCSNTNEVMQERDPGTAWISHDASVTACPMMSGVRPSRFLPEPSPSFEPRVGTQPPAILFICTTVHLLP
jgi:hypothetical protein